MDTSVALLLQWSDVSVRGAQTFWYQVRSEHSGPPGDGEPEPRYVQICFVIRVRYSQVGVLGCLGPHSSAQVWD